MDDYVDRSPAKSRAMRAAYAGLEAAEATVRDDHARGDWDSHHEAVRVLVTWHAEIGRIAVEEARRG